MKQKKIRREAIIGEKRSIFRLSRSHSVVLERGKNTDPLRRGGKTEIIW